MKTRIALTALVAVFVFGFSTTVVMADSHEEPPITTGTTETNETVDLEQQAVEEARKAREAALRKRLVKEIKFHRSKTWYWQNLSLRSRTKTQYQERRVHSLSYLKWMVKLWDNRRKAAKRYTQNPPNLGNWLCIHREEGDWEDGGNPYWGGLQMDIDFMEAHGLDMLRKYGYPRGSVGPNGWINPWTRVEQMAVAERARRGIRTRLVRGRVVLWQDRARGYRPWPNTARECGLL